MCGRFPRARDLATPDDGLVLTDVDMLYCNDCNYYRLNITIVEPPPSVSELWIFLAGEHETAQNEQTDGLQAWKTIAGCRLPPAQSLWSALIFKGQTCTV